MDYSYETFLDEDAEAGLIAAGVTAPDGTPQRDWFADSVEESKAAIALAHVEMERERQLDAFLAEVREGYGDDHHPA